MVGALNCSAVYDDDQCVMANACCEQQCSATSMVTSTCDYPAGCVCSEPDGTPSNLGGIIGAWTWAARGGPSHSLHPAPRAR